MTLKSLILIEEKKFEDALNVLKIIEMESNSLHPEKYKSHKRTKSGNFDTISTVIEYKK